MLVILLQYSLYFPIISENAEILCVHSKNLSMVLI